KDFWRYDLLQLEVSSPMPSISLSSDYQPVELFGTWNSFLFTSLDAPFSWLSMFSMNLHPGKSEREFHSTCHCDGMEFKVSGEYTYPYSSKDNLYINFKIIMMVSSSYLKLHFSSC